MTTPIPLETFSPELLPGETVVWTGQPNPSVIFHREDWGVIPFSLMWGGFAIFWLLGASGLWDIWQNKPSHRFELFGIIWGTPFVLVGQYFIWGRFVHRRWKKKHTYYAVTSRRALIVEYRLRNRTASSAWFEALAQIDKNVRTDGIGSISFGGPVTGEWQWGKNNPPRPPTFDDIDNVDSVYQLAVRFYDQARKSASGTPQRWLS